MTDGVARTFRLDELAELVGGRVVGDGARVVAGVATLDAAAPDRLSFLTNPRYRERAEASAAGALLVPPSSGLSGRDLLVVDEPYLALARILTAFHPPRRPAPGVSPDARLGDGVTLGARVHVGPFAVVEDGCELGDDVVLGPGVVVGAGATVGARSEIRPAAVLYPGTVVGADCLVHAGVVLGADGFGFATSGGVHHKIPQLGRVVVEDGVEIGANTAVDRGALDDTVIGAGSKLDDLVMVAHGVRLGRGSLLAAQSGVAGSTRVGDHAVFAGQAGAAGHLTLGDRVVVAAKSAVFDDLDDGAFVAGIPATDHRGWKRSQALYRRLPELARDVRRMGTRLDRLERGAREDED